MEQLLYKMNEVSLMTGFSRTFLYDQINAGKLRVIRIQRTTRVLATDLLDWVEGEGRGE